MADMLAGLYTRSIQLQAVFNLHVFNFFPGEFTISVVRCSPLRKKSSYVVRATLFSDSHLAILYCFERERSFWEFREYNKKKRLEKQQ